MSIAMTVGPIVGGVLSSVVTWRAIFLVNLPLTLLAFFIGLRTVPADPPKARQQDSTFDLVGTLLLFASMCSLILPLTLLQLGYISLPWLVPTYVILVVAVLAFVRWERRQATPLVEPRLFLVPTFRAACISDTFANISQFPIAVVISIFIQTYLDRSGTTAGIVIAVGSVTMILFAPIGGRMADRFGRRLPALLGRCAIVAGSLLLMLSDVGNGLAILLVGLGVMSMGGGLSYPAVQASAIESAPRRYSGMAAGVFSTTSFTGGIIGLTAISVYLSGDDLLASQFRLIYLAFALTGIVSVFFASRLEPWPKHENEDAFSSIAPQAA
jgi:DHA2 family methylenomycin A resistance protein-like MFS transporter